MKMKLTFLLLFMTSILAQEKYILCREVGCQYDPDVSLNFQSGGQDYTSFEISPNIDPIRINNEEGEKSRKEVRGKIYNSSYLGQNIAIDLSSKNEESRSSDFLLVSDIVDTLNVVLNGYSGVSGLDSTQICANNFLNDVYGSDAKTYFENRRSSDNSLENKCDLTDIDYLKNEKFICPVGYEEVSDTLFNVTRFEKKRKCVASGARSLCVKRTYDITCSPSIKTQTSQCCNNLNQNGLTLKNDWFNENIDGLWIPIPEGWTCDPNKCETKFENTTPVFRNGVVPSTNWSARVNESDFNLGATHACSSALVGSEPNLAWSTQVHSIPGDPASPLVEGPPKYDEDAVLYSGRPNNNHFDIPVPDIISIPNNNDEWDYQQRRYVIDTSRSSVRLRNCLGLDGSDPFDTRCERLKGGAGAVRLRAIDRRGAVGNELTINVPIGEHRYYSRYNYIYGTGTTQFSYPTIASPYNNNWTSHIFFVEGSSLDGPLSRNGGSFNGMNEDFNNDISPSLRQELKNIFVNTSGTDYFLLPNGKKLYMSGNQAQYRSHWNLAFYMPHCNDVGISGLLSGTNECFVTRTQNNGWPVVWYQYGSTCAETQTLPFREEWHMWDPDGGGGHYDKQSIEGCVLEYLQ